jgi:hypothetical protein
MPKRQLQKDSPATVEAMAKALAKGRVLDLDETAAFCDFHANARIVRHASEVVLYPRGGAWVMRRSRGCKGADLTDHPLMLAAKRADRDFLSDEVKLRRVPPLRQSLAARKEAAAATENLVLSLLNTYADKGRGAAAFVARKSGLTSQHVRRIAKKRT